MIQILSVRELRHMTRRALETHRGALCLAKLDAPTELEKERIGHQIDRVNSLLNEYRPMEVYH